MKRYKNYIFDFYGTLVEIDTDENQLELWDQLTQIYNAFGCQYGPRQLKSTYHKFVDEAEKMLIESNVHEFVEIELKQIFIRLLIESPQKVRSENLPNDYDTFGQTIATTFRVLSRKKFETYMNTLSVLIRLKEIGANLYILSNAQRVFTKAELELSGCADLVDKIYLSSDYQMKKPDADFLQLVLEENQLNPEETVIIGNDLSADIAIAQTAGIDGILLNTFPYSWDEIEAYRSKGWNFAIINDILELLD